MTDEPTTTSPAGARRHAPRRLDFIIPPLAACLLGLVARITVFLRKRAEGAYDVVDTAAATEVALVIVTLLMLVASGSRLAATWRAIGRRAASLWLLYFVFGAAMAIVSFNPAYSIFRATEALSQALAVAVILRACGNFARAEKLALLLGWGALLMDVAGRYRLTGYFGTEFSSNSFSATAAMLTCYCVGEATEARGQRRQWLCVSALAAFGLVLLGMSLASWWSVLLAVALIAVVLRPNVALILGLLAAALAAVLWGPQMMNDFVLRNRPMRELITLHGRLSLWQFYWEAIRDRPWMGYGYAVGARLMGYYTTHTHNLVLATLLGLGIPGLGLMLAYYVQQVRDILAARRAGTPGWVGCTAALACGTSNSMAFAFLGEAWMPATLFFACLVMLLALYVRPTPAPARSAIQAGRVDDADIGGRDAGLAESSPASSSSCL